MLTKKQYSSLILVKIRGAKKFSFIVPIPLLVLEETINAISDLFWIIETPISLFAGKHNDSHIRNFFRLKGSSQIIRLCSQLLHELRSTGRLRLVEVKNEEALVYIDLF